MSIATHELSFNGEHQRRGFWLYVWEVTTPEQTHLYYVGRTGDSSSINAQSPFNRMGQHLSFNSKGNALRPFCCPMAEPYEEKAKRKKEWP